MKRILSVLLCLCMLLSAVAIFSSCKKDDELEIGEDITLDLNDYAVVCGAELTAMARDEAYVAANTLRSLSGVSTMRAWEDKEDSPIDTEDKEILVGDVNRTQVADAKSKIKNHGWIITAYENKLVIVGTTPLLTRIALQYFNEHYVNGDAVKEGTLTVSREVLASDVAMLKLAENKNSKYALVYDDYVDDDENAPNNTKTENGVKVPYYDYSVDADPNGGPTTDTTYKYCLELKELFATTTGAKRDTIELKKASAAVTSGEIFVGNVNRPEYKAQAGKIEASEYGVAISEGKIMLLAWNDVTLKLITPLFQDMLDGSKLKDGSYMMPADCFFKVSPKSSVLKVDWEVNFPKPEGEGIQLDGTVDAGTNSLEYIYTGAGVNAASYSAYCAKLEQAGYTALAGTKRQVGNDMYCTYVNEKEKITLHVYLSTYSYAPQYQITDVLPSIRIIAASTENVTLPAASMLDSTAYDNRTYPTVGTAKTGISQLKLNYAAKPKASFGNSYFYTLADGSFVVYDGGANLGMTDADHMWDALNAMYKLIHGTEPTEQKPLHIRAWLLSHEHMDHFTVLREFLTEHGKDVTVKMDALLYNPVSASERVNSHNPETAIQNNMTTLQNAVTGGFDFIKVHTGQVFYFVNLKLEVLYTHEDVYPKGLEYFNNSSTVFRGTLKTTDGTNLTESTMVWLGDLERIGGRRLCAAYGPTLDADMVQLAHHGYNAVSFLVYQLIAPEVVWWPVAKSSFDDQITTKATVTFEGVKRPIWYRDDVDYRVGNDLASVEVILCADTYDTTMFVTGTKADWSYTKSGDVYTYTNLVDLIEDQPIVGKHISKVDRTKNNSVVVDKRQ